jgi:hypothetical protein
MWLNSPSSTAPTFGTGINESGEGIMYKHILIPTDGSTLSSKAVEVSLLWTSLRRALPNPSLVWP